MQRFPKQTNTLDLTNCIVFCLGNYQIENDDDDESMKQKIYKALWIPRSHVTLTHKIRTLINTRDTYRHILHACDPFCKAGDIRERVTEAR